MNKKAILLLLLLSSIGASTVNISAAGLLNEILYGKTATQKAVEAVKGFTKDLTEAVIKKGPKAIIGGFISLIGYKGAEAIWDYGVSAPCSLAVNTLKPENKGIYISKEKAIEIGTKLQKAEMTEVYVKTLREQVEDQEKMIQLLQEALTSGYTIKDDTPDKDSPATEPAV